MTVLEKWVLLQLNIVFPTFLITGKIIFHIKVLVINRHVICIKMLKKYLSIIPEIIIIFSGYCHDEDLDFSPPEVEACQYYIHKFISPALLGLLLYYWFCNTMSGFIKSQPIISLQLFCCSTWTIIYVYNFFLFCLYIGLLLKSGT